MTDTPMLSVAELEVRYGRLIAVRDVSLTVATGEIVCIVGPNGAGKSTTLAAVAGGVPKVRGTVTLAGQDISAMKPENIAKLGVSLVPEGRHVFASLTVEDNLRVGTFMRGKVDVAAEMDRVFTHFPRLAERRKQAAGKLSGGEQQMLVIGRALMTAPKIILVDEPSLGLAPMIIDQVYAILVELREREGLTLLINEQSSERMLKFADRIYVMREGLMQLEGTRRELEDGKAIQSAYFGFDAHTATMEVAE
ncbi:ABC transporter ATP-binding protein [Acuticoccus sp. I52.16.1]|uniref:ABC transporter ATP-binding protein n=1 Tax=Acuticoccus sp. I52.16.1 TaxID=2928472 RepID=UPI001FD07D9E|nr:ABC transporter ATP-binding protein [Acuticoccus sp. I52.16.1]UOM35479.1 ABC transporter ATP-binding protein [Acuticoccus sp. I52.16.1]